MLDPGTDQHDLPRLADTAARSLCWEGKGVRRGRGRTGPRASAGLEAGGKVRAFIPLRLCRQPAPTKPDRFASVFGTASSVLWSRRGDRWQGRAAAGSWWA